MNSIKLKICGAQSIEEALELSKRNVDYIGLNFTLHSKRRIEIDHAKAISDVIKDTNTKVVALFQDQPVALIQEYADTIKADFVQLHGNEHHSYVDQIKQPIIKSIPLGRFSDAEEVITYMNTFKASFYQLDRSKQGSGPLINVERANAVINHCGRDVFLAGGLTPDNLKNVLSVVHPFGIDIAGGVRTDDTLDLTKVDQVVDLVRGHT